jgi:hypothetical protein
MSQLLKGKMIFKTLYWFLIDRRAERLDTVGAQLPLSLQRHDFGERPDSRAPHGVKRRLQGKD